VFQVRVVGQHVLDCHARGEQFEDALDGVAQPLIVGWPWQIVGSDVIRASRDMSSPYRSDPPVWSCAMSCTKSCTPCRT
jgi:hypothetical protein